MTQRLRSAFGSAGARPAGAALALAWVLAAALPSPAQQPAPTGRLFLSFRPGDTMPDSTPRPNVLRPNVLQEVFAYVKNDAAEAQEYTVQLLASGVPVATQKVQVPRGALSPASWGAAPTAAKEPVLQELRGEVAFRLLNAKGEKQGNDLPLDVDRPSNYVDVSYIRYFPGTDGNNRLVVVVKANKEFKGPPCRVELVLRPDRIPGLVAARKGVYAGYLTGPDRKLVLVAEDLEFTGETGRNGLVYLTVDGYERAFTFDTTFPRVGTESTPTRIQETSLILAAPPFSVPKPAVPVVVEVDDLKLENARIKLELFSPVPKEVPKEVVGDEVSEYSELAEFRGERSQKLFFSTEGPRGGLLFRPEVRDWTAGVDLADVYGPTRLRVRLVDDQGKPVLVLDKRRDRKEVAEVTETIVLDNTPPVDVRFAVALEKAVRGEEIELLATGDDPESGISDVTFFVGKLLPDGKLPPEAVTVPGVFGGGADGKGWAARLPIATDEKDTLLVGVRFTNRVGLSKSAFLTLAVEGPPKSKEAAAKKASIAGQVLEGDRPQDGLTVQLIDATPKVIKTTTTKDGGKYAFADLEPGTYRVFASKVSSNTRGEVSVVLAEGEKKVDVEIKLFR